MLFKRKISYTVLLVICFALTLGMQSCSKYEESGISFRSRTERVANNWKVENYKVNGNDMTSMVSGYSESFTHDGAYYYDWGVLNGNGAWTFQNKDKEIKLNGKEDHANRVLIILKLEEKAFWYYYIEDNDRHDVHLIEKN